MAARTTTSHRGSPMIRSSSWGGRHAGYTRRQSSRTPYRAASGWGISRILGWPDEVISPRPDEVMAPHRRLYLASTRMSPFPAWTLPVAPRSQQTVRRNAHHAAIACARRRQQRENVERFLARHDATAGDAVRQQLGL